MDICDHGLRQHCYRDGQEFGPPKTTLWCHCVFEWQREGVQHRNTQNEGAQNGNTENGDTQMTQNEDEDENKDEEKDRPPEPASDSACQAS